MRGTLTPWSTSQGLARWRIQEELRDEGLAFTSPLGHREVALMVSDLENSRVSSSIVRPCMLQVPELGPWSQTDRAPVPGPLTISHGTESPSTSVSSVRWGQ